MHNKSRKLVRQSTSSEFKVVNDHVVDYLVNYMKKNQITMPTLFNEIDLNGDGYISKKEMKHILNKKIVKFCIIFLQRLLSFLQVCTDGRR